MSFCLISFLRFSSFCFISFFKLETFSLIWASLAFFVSGSISSFKAFLNIYSSSSIHFWALSHIKNNFKWNKSLLNQFWSNLYMHVRKYYGRINQFNKDYFCWAKGYGNKVKRLKKWVIWRRLYWMPVGFNYIYIFYCKKAAWSH